MSGQHLTYVAASRCTDEHPDAFAVIHGATPNGSIRTIVLSRKQALAVARILITVAETEGDR